MARSLALWHRLPQQAGKDFGFEACGVLFVTDSPAELEDWSRWRTMATTHGVACDQLTQAEVEQRIPAGTKRWVGGLYSAEDGRAEPARVVPELAKACQALGVRIYEQCAARVLDVVDGRVRGVATERGLIKSNAVLCAGGVWTALFARKHGVDVPQGFVHGSVLCTEPGAPVFDVSVATPTFCARRRSDDGYTVAMSGRGTVHITPSLLRHAWKFLPLYRIRRKGLKVRLGKAFFDELFAPDWNADTASPFEKSRTLDPAPDPELLARALAEFRSGMPGMQAARGASSWGASVDSLARCDSGDLGRARGAGIFSLDRIQRTRLRHRARCRGARRRPGGRRCAARRSASIPIHAPRRRDTAAAAMNAARTLRRRSCLPRRGLA